MKKKEDKVYVVLTGPGGVKYSNSRYRLELIAVCETPYIKEGLIRHDVFVRVPLYQDYGRKQADKAF